MKRFLILLLLCAVSAHAHMWIHNKSKYYIRFTAETTVGDESIRVSSGYADYVGDFKYTFAIYKKFKIYYIDANGNEHEVFTKGVSEGGNRKIVVKDNGTPESIYIAEDVLEGRIPSSWGHKNSAEDTGKRWL